MILRRFFIAAAFAFALAFILVPRAARSPEPKQTAPAESAELRSKQSMMQQDIARTDQLCRTQCLTDLRLAAEQLNGLPNAADNAVRRLLTDVQKEHPHMEKFVWKSGQGNIVNIGTVTGGLAERVKPYIAEAENAAGAKREHYESPQIEWNGSYYFVAGLPGKVNGSTLTGVIRQDILGQVKKHQEKNLRLVPYPSDKRYKIEAVDSRTLKKVQVDEPKDNQGTSHYHNQQIVVKFEKNPTAEQLEAMKKEIGAKFVQKLGYTYVFESHSLNTMQMMSYFKKHNAQYSEPHYLYMTNDRVDGPSSGFGSQEAANPDKGALSHGIRTLKDKGPLHNGSNPDARAQLHSTANKGSMELEPNQPNDALFSKYQWNLPITDTLRGWDLSKGSNDVIVAVVDTGADLNHPDLAEHLVAGYNFVANNDKPKDDVGHGTHVSGIISAVVNNGEGVAGMTWYNKIMPVKVLDSSGAGDTYTVAKGIIWATDHGAKVINLSLGNYAQAQFLHDAVKYAFDHDVALISASGNDNTEDPGYPAAYPEVFAVSATDSNRDRASFSNMGDYVDVVAPGVNIASTYPTNQYAALSGTSMACPHVAALAALIRTANPLLKNTEVYEIMRQTAIDLGNKGHDKYFGYGQIDVAKALEAANGSSESLSLWPQFFERHLRSLLLKP